VKTITIKLAHGSANTGSRAAAIAIIVNVSNTSKARRLDLSHPIPSPHVGKKAMDTVTEDTPAQ